MEQYHKPSNKRVSSGTGGRRRAFRDKESAHLGGVFAATKVSDVDSTVKVRQRGGTKRPKIKKASSINVVMGKACKKVRIIRVLKSHNPEYVRMNIITKGAIVETELGKVQVTNRVGQDGVVNGVLVK